MQAAIWNLTDATPLATSGTAVESRALMAQAAVTENSVPGGLAPIANPNAGSADTGAVDAAGAVLPPAPAEEAVPPPPIRFDSAALFPARLVAGRSVRADLVLATSGDVTQLALRIQRRAAGRWRAVRALPDRELAATTTTVPVTLGRLARGRYRLVVAVSGSDGTAVVQRLPFRIR
jgi:hypothetical protein